MKTSSTKKLKGRGGPGRGQGLKKKYGEPTKVIRVPVSLIPVIEKMLEAKKSPQQ